MRRVMKRPCPHTGFYVSLVLSSPSQQHQWMVGTTISFRIFSRYSIVFKYFKMFEIQSSVNENQKIYYYYNYNYLFIYMYIFFVKLCFKSTILMISFFKIIIM